MLAALDRLVGRWQTEATHPMVPGVVVRVTADFAWLEGRRFLEVRTTNDHPLFPAELAFIGCMDHDRADAVVPWLSNAPRLWMHAVLHPRQGRSYGDSGCCSRTLHFVAHSTFRR